MHELLIRHARIHAKIPPLPHFFEPTAPCTARGWDVDYSGDSMRAEAIRLVWDDGMQHALVEIGWANAELEGWEARAGRRRDLVGAH